MAQKKSAATRPSRPRSFAGVIRGHSRSVQRIATALRDVVFEELPDAQEAFYGGHQAMAIYRTTAEVCWIQPLKERCNIYFMCGPELTDAGHDLEGTSNRHRHAKIRSTDDVERLPLRGWLRESVALNNVAISGGISFEEVLQRLQTICLTMPDTKETITWGKPHFRVGDKIFCGCGENQGCPSLGLKIETHEARLMMNCPGIVKAPYSRPNDGWVSIDPRTFDDWVEIERLIEGSYRLIASKRTVALLDAQQQ